MSLTQIPLHPPCFRKPSVLSGTAGYAADGYARVKRLSALVTTISDGEFSTMNAIAGAYSEQVPIIHIVGQPSTDIQRRKIVGLHHTLGNDDYDVFVRISAEVSCFVARLNYIREATQLIYMAVRQAWLQSMLVCTLAYQRT